MSKKSENQELAADHQQADIKPYQRYKRNEAGLIEGFPYKYNEDFSVNWKACLNPKYIVLNKEKKDQIVSKYGRGFDELQLAIQEGTQDPDDIDDAFKFILLAGIKELAKLRGYSNVDYFNSVTGPEYVATKCTIFWNPNYETDNKSVMFSSLADAHLGNTKSFSQQFLNTISENRSFVRAVRNFLNIHVVGYDEIGTASPVDEPQTTTNSFSATDPRFVLKKKFDELTKDHNVGFNTFHKWLTSPEKKNAAGEFDYALEWKSIQDVPKDKAFEVIGLIKEVYEKQEAKKNK